MRSLVAFALALTILVAALAFVPGAQADVRASKRINTVEVIRDNAGTANVAIDDVFILDVDDDDEVGLGDFVVASGDSRIPAGVGVTDDMDSILGEDFEVNAFLVYADVDETGTYTSGDWVFLSSSATSLPSASNSADLTDYSIRLTDTDEGEAGTAMRTTDDDRQDWSGDVSSNLGSGSSVGAFTWEDDDDDALIDDGEAAFFTPGPVSAGAAIPSNAIEVTWRGSGSTDTDSETQSESESQTQSESETQTARDTVTVTTTVTRETTRTVEGEDGDGDRGFVPGPGLLWVGLALVGAVLLARRKL